MNWYDRIIALIPLTSLSSFVMRFDSLRHLEIPSQNTRYWCITLHFHSLPSPRPYIRSFMIVIYLLPFWVVICSRGPLCCWCLGVDSMPFESGICIQAPNLFQCCEGMKMWCYQSVFLMTELELFLARKTRPSKYGTHSQALRCFRHFGGIRIRFGQLHFLRTAPALFLARRI